MAVPTRILPSVVLGVTVVTGSQVGSVVILVPGVPLVSTQS